MSTNPYVFETGSIEDIDGKRLPVGVDHDTVTIGPPHNQWVLTPSQYDELINELDAAADTAAANSRRMAEEDRS